MLETKRPVTALLLTVLEPPPDLPFVIADLAISGHMMVWHGIWPNLQPRTLREQYLTAVIYFKGEFSQIRGIVTLKYIDFAQCGLAFLLYIKDIVGLTLILGYFVQCE
ncbi:MAG: hypothetical protein ABJ388_00265 [Alphaproteobacteria bacterium]|uniref:hypothetical protein n=1 Tax=Roseibium sp. TaxID=1936156 RepID=UPI0032910EE7